MAVFPTGFPNPRRTNYSPQRKPQVIESDMEVGPPLSRRISTVREYTIPVEMVVTAAQLEIFQDWFDDAAGGAGGSAWFTGLVLDIGDGKGLRTTVECKMAGGTYDLSVYKSTLKWLLKFIVETR